MSRPQAERLQLAGPAGELETMVESPPGPAGVAVICHPHPLYHGTMTNKVVHTLARAFNDLNYAAVRFNFRGVGNSGGEYADAIGETDDVLAVADWARQRWADLPLWLAGFSFGSYVSLHAAARVQPHGLVSVAVPVQRFDVGALRQPQCPWIVIQGDHDELVEADEVVTWIDSLEPGPELVVLEGVDHFFHGRLRELRQVVTSLVQPHLAT
ncbi:MAG: alpha/beta hydrolase [Gammaproteobacteria bacterium]|nr:alpha/beta hydrolase [Gammaproteobacteria bacterium]NNF61009.1 alpha/beta hydrolase [Gammaproteobacteria bacterium]NNM21077.1 alpha/beta hydrolase [Gammaproteobacteria bacterium]